MAGRRWLRGGQPTDEQVAGAARLAMRENGQMPRAIWNGAVSFGLVNVPIRLVSATSPKDVRFNQLHDKDLGRINQRRVCSLDGEEVEFSHIVKGYDLGGGRYVTIDTEELESLDPKASRTIDIEEFVDLADIDPLYFEHSYYLLPDSQSTKAYTLLVEAMSSAGKVALGRFVLRTKQYLVALRPKDGVLVASTMLYADEVIGTEDLDLPAKEATEVTERELSMAEQLIDSLSAEFDPTRFHDTYREQVLHLIEQKAEGVEPAPAPEPVATAPVVDLMAALEASLNAAKGKEGKGAGDKRPRRPARRAG
jgi:DNA end-binding protein Ku